VAGGVCPVLDETCTNAEGATCQCVGPPGAAYLTCDLVNPGSGGSSDGGSSGSSGTASGGAGGGLDGGAGKGGGSGGGGSATLVGKPCGDKAPYTTTGTAAYTLSVDAGQKGEAWSRFYEVGVAADHANTVLSTAWGRNIQGALKKGHDQAGFGYVRFHGILNGDINVYTEVGGTPTYNWTRFDQVYDAIKNAGMRPVVEISFMPPPLASGGKTVHWYNGVPANTTPPKDWNRWMDFMAAIVTHLEGRYGADEVRNNWYFEIWNESSWMYSKGTGGYTELFGYTARGLYKGDPKIKIGGPAGSSGESVSLINSLISYCRTNSIKLDFVTYHYYGADGGGIAKSAGAVAFAGTIDSTIKRANFTGEILNTEFGACAATDVIRDNEVSASYIAKVSHLLGTSAGVPPPVMNSYWTISDLYEEINTGGNLAYREGNYGLFLKGDPKIPESFDVAKPAFNAFRLLHMMTDFRLPTTGGTTADGVNAAATISKDGNSVQVLLYNHQDNKAGDSASSKLVTLTVKNLGFTPTKVRHYVVDKTHSNSYDTWVGMGKPAKPSQAQWSTLADAAEICYYESTPTVTAGSWTATFPQNMYSVGLVELIK
jgi:xylan 1,4-beta-xylosidase